MRSQEEITEVAALKKEMQALREAVEAWRDRCILYYPHLDWGKVIEMPKATEESE